MLSSYKWTRYDLSSREYSSSSWMMHASRPTPAIGLNILSVIKISHFASLVKALHSRYNSANDILIKMRTRWLSYKERELLSLNNL